MIHFKFVGIKDMHNIYYLGLSGERSLPFGLLVACPTAFYGNLSSSFAKNACMKEKKT